MTKVVHKISDASGIIEVSLDDGTGKNYLTHQFCEELNAILDDAAADPTCKVLLVRGRDDVFCGGAPPEVLEGIFEGRLDLEDIELPKRVLAFPAPIVAALEGSAVGGGLALALCCDVTVAAENRRYGANFSAMGFTPGMGTTALLASLVGHDFACEMMLTAKFYKGRELAGRGLFTHIVAAGDVYTHARDLALRIAEKEAHVVRMIKDTLATRRITSVEEAISRERLMHRICFSMPGARDRIRENYPD